MQTSHLITKQDIAALKTADRLVIRYIRDTDISRIECIKDASESNPWEQVHVVPVMITSSAYNDEYTNEVASAFLMLWATRYDNPLRTILDTLKAGDVLAIQFNADNNNGYLKEAYLHADECRLTVIRPGEEAAKDKKWYYLLACGVCADNTARMCKVRTRTAYSLTA